MCPKSRQASIRYDDGSYNVWFDRSEISLLTIDGRKRFPIFVSEYFKQYLNWRRNSAEFFIRDNKVFLHIVFSKDISDTELTGKVVGIDRGIKKLPLLLKINFLVVVRLKKFLSVMKN